MTTYSLSPPNAAVSRSKLLHVAAILSSVVVAAGYAGAASGADQRTLLLAQTSDGNTLARCRQLSALWSRHNTNGYARPLEVDAAIEDCRKGNYAAGIAALTRALNRAQIPVPTPTESATR
jgi:hypothetical protein